MSRSYKKPWVKDPANRYMKKVSARRFRRKSHTLEHISKLNTGVYFFSKSCEVMNSYDVCDYRFKLDDSIPQNKRK